jgi:hypothetical protein
MARVAADSLAYLVVTDERMLGSLTEFIGDAHVWLPAVELIEDHLSLPFLIQEWPLSKSRRTWLGALRVKGARAFTVEDKAHVGAHQFMDLAFDASASGMTIRAQPDLTIRVDVDLVDVEVEVFSTEGPPLREFKFLFGLGTASGSPDMAEVRWLR